MTLDIQVKGTLDTEKSSAAGAPPLLGPAGPVGVPVTAADVHTDTAAGLHLDSARVVEQLSA